MIIIKTKLSNDLYNITRRQAPNLKKRKNITHKAATTTRSYNSPMQSYNTGSKDKKTKLPEKPSY
jgi:hypothetical protein